MQQERATELNKPETAANNFQYQRIRIKNCYPPGIKTFDGKWILGTGDYGLAAMKRDASGQLWMSYRRYSVALSKGGRIVVCVRDGHRTEHEIPGWSVVIYDTFDEFYKSMEKQDARSIVDEVYHFFARAGALTEEYLDI